MNVRFSNMGWIAAAGLAGIMVAGGFQSPNMKVAGADLDKIVQASDFYKNSEASFNEFAQKRSDVYDFVGTNKAVITSDQVTQILSLWLKDSPTDQDKAQLERVKSDVIAQEKRREELTIKQTLTPEERTLLGQWQNLSQANDQVLAGLSQKFQQDIQAKRASIMNDATDRARKAIQAVGKAQGCTVVYTAAAAPYTATDVTTDAISAMNAQK